MRASQSSSSSSASLSFPLPKLCVVNTTTMPLNWTESPPPAPPGGWPVPLNASEAAKISPPPSSLPLTNTTPPPLPSLPPDLTLNVTYSPPPPPRQWEILVPCNVTADVSPPPPPSLIFGLFDTTTVAAIVIFAAGVAAFYYIRRRRLRAELLAVKSLEVKTLDGEVHKSRVLRRAKKGFDELGVDGSGSVDLVAFSRFLGVSGNSPWGERLMAVFDTRGNGTVSFREFVVGMGVLGSKHRERVDPMFYFCFKLLDADKSGAVSRNELLSIVWQYVKDKEREASRVEWERQLGGGGGKKLSEYWRDEEEARAPRREYQGSSQLANQNVDKLKTRGDDLEELMAWANDARGALAEPTAAQERESAAARRRRERVQTIRRRMQGTVILLRREYPPEITPRDFQAVLAKVPEPFAETFGMFKRLRPYMAPCAKVVDAVPALRLDELRAEQSAAGTL